MEQDEGGQRIQNWLKCYKCEDFNEVMDMWDDTLNYRNLQIKYLKANDLESVREFLDSWPSYKLPSGYKLVQEKLYQNVTYVTRDLNLFSVLSLPWTLNKSILSQCPHINIVGLSLRKKLCI